MHIFFLCKHRRLAVAGKEGTELDDLWHEAPRNELFSVFRFCSFFRSCECRSCRFGHFTIGGQDEIIEEISKLSLQGGLEQAVNILAAGRNSAACAVRCSAQHHVGSTVERRDETDCHQNCQRMQCMCRCPYQSLQYVTIFSVTM